MLSSNYNNITTLGHNTGSSGSVILASIIFAVFGIIVYLFMAFVLSKIFHKANRKKSLAYIPVYNYWVLFEIADLPGWLALLLILGAIPVIGLVIAFVLQIILAIKLAEKFNKSMVFTIFGLIIFTIIGYLMLAFGEAQYNTSDVPPTDLTTNQLDQATTQSPQNDLSSNMITPNMNVTSDVPSASPTTNQLDQSMAPQSSQSDLSSDMNVTSNVSPVEATEPNQVVNSDMFGNQTVSNTNATQSENPVPTNSPVEISNPTDSSNEPTNTDNLNQVNNLTDNLVEPSEDISSNVSPPFPSSENQSTETQDSSQGNL